MSDPESIKARYDRGVEIAYMADSIRDRMNADKDSRARLVTGLIHDTIISRPETLDDRSSADLVEVFKGLQQTNKYYFDQVNNLVDSYIGRKTGIENPYPTTPELPPARRFIRSLISPLIPR